MKRKKIITLAGIIAIIVLMVTVIMGTVSKQKQLALDEEIRRSMTYDQVKDSDKAISGTNYVEFDAFFLRDLNGDGNAEGIRGTCREVGSEDTLYMEINVKSNGRFEEGAITVNAENMYLQTSIVKDIVVKDSYISSNTRNNWI